MVSFSKLLHSTPDSPWALSALVTDGQAVKAEPVLPDKLGSLAHCQRGKPGTALDVVMLFAHNTCVTRLSRLEVYGRRWL